MTEMQDSHDQSTQISEGIAEGVRKSKIRLTDRRMIVIYLVLVVFVILSTLWQQSQTNKVKNSQDQIQQLQRQLQDFQVRAQQAAVANCEATNTGNRTFNTTLTQLAMNAQNATSLTAEQKAAAVETYGRLHLTITDCSKLPVK